MTRSLRKITLAVPVLALAAAPMVHAGTVTVDGIITADDGYGMPVKVYTDNYVNGVDASGGTNQVSTYFTFDATKVYGAIHLDSGPAAFGGANVYVYSSSLNKNLDTNKPGVYGDGDDVILEGGNGWKTSLNVYPWGSASQAYDPSTVDYVFNGTDTVEFSIARSLLGNYDSFRYGGQLFAYEFHRGGDRVEGAIVNVDAPAAVPLPGAVAGGVALFGTLAAKRKRRQA